MVKNRKSFGNGILVAVAMTAVTMVLVYTQGHTPNPGILVGTGLYGLWHRFGSLNGGSQ